MTGTKDGGIQAGRTNIEKYGKGFYKRIGKLGGSAPKKTPSGFAYLKANGQLDKIAEAGRKGGASSKPYSRNPKTSEWEKHK